MFVHNKQRKKKRYHFKFTYEDISKITGYSIDTLRQKVSRKHFNPRDLVSLSKFIVRELLREKPPDSSIDNPQGKDEANNNPGQ